MKVLYIYIYIHISRKSLLFLVGNIFFIHFQNCSDFLSHVFFRRLLLVTLFTLLYLSFIRIFPAILYF